MGASPRPVAALIGYTLLWLLAVAIPVFVVVFVVALAAELSGVVAFILAIPLGLGLVALLVYLWTVLSFAPPLIVLERLGVFPSIARSVRLVRGDFWRVFGIRLLATIVAGVVAFAVSIPFSLTGQILLFGSESTPMILFALVLVAVGGPSARSSPPLLRGRGGSAIHRPTNPRRGVRPRPADRCGERAAWSTTGFDRPPVAHPTNLTCLQ